MAPPRSQFFSSRGTAVMIQITRDEYDGFVEIAHKYANLCQNLMCGGVGEETIQLLSNQVSTAQGHQNADTAPPVPAQAATRDVARPQLPEVAANGRQRCREPRPDHEDQMVIHHNLDTSSDSEEEYVDAFEPAAGETTESGPEAASHLSARPRLEREATRSIMLVNLADKTRHADITSVVRGGMLLDIFMKPRENAAVISFLHGVDAQAFYEHVREHGLIIKNRKVDVKWNHFQFTLPGNTAHKISLGATRNLVIRRRNPNLTEQMIRDDLEHIHNLFVVRVEFIGESCYISTNSVHKAAFARLCLMSRREYKDSHVEWGIDECAQPLNRMPIPNRFRLAPAPAPSKPVDQGPLSNRFELLSMDN
ncbi:RNA recognition motif containing protein [Purpureocillium lavendulum]|uniref:RNA recognition motif containing protein n=1 Tax=Purpureocillium lavendulum TaxID=1247861 RepID=A0AB34G6Z1_9HYPO|nr:RNA recognition motif containing protein [Purpureocillium lavendulum]